MADNEAYRGNSRREGDEFKDRILSELQRIHNDVRNVDAKLDLLQNTEISNIKVELGMLKIKSGFWGLAGGALGIFLLLLGKRLGL